MDEKKVLLLVDDEPSILQSLKRLFRGGPYEVVTAESGTKGLEQLAAGIPVRGGSFRLPDAGHEWGRISQGGL